jgi:hypothetical protein
LSRNLGHEGGRDDPAELALVRQIAIELRATGARCIDQDPVWGLCLTRADAWINVGLPGAKAAEVDALSLVLVGDRGHRHGILVDIQTDVECARVTHG